MTGTELFLGGGHKAFVGGFVCTMEELDTRAWTTRLRRFFRSRGVHEADAEDLAQETWLRFTRHPEYGAQSDSAQSGALLFTIARNLLRNRYRSSLTRLSALGALRLASHAGDLRDDVEKRASLRAVDREIAALDPMSAEILRLRAYAGLDYDAIGVLVGLRTAAVRKRLSRARDVLRRAVDDA